MTNRHIEFRNHILALVQDRGFQVEAAQIQAKALLSEIVGVLPAYNWTYIPQRIIRNITIATFELETIAGDDPADIDALSAAAWSLALAWEALAKLGESTTQETALLNTAINYELAGYQANASCIAKRLIAPQPVETVSLMTRMGALFLQRRFRQMFELTKLAQVEPRGVQGISTSLVETMAVALAGNAFFQAAQFFLWGDVHAIERATTIFKDSERLFATLNLVEYANLVRGIRSLLPTMQRRATWTILPSYAPNQPKWHRYLKLLARGTSTDIFRAASISELWPSQLAALQGGILSSDASKAIKMPTSAGKTRIAELAIVHTLITNPGAKCIYVAPYRALVSELEVSFLNIFHDLGYRVSSIQGTYESDEFEELLFRETDILVTTPEKLDLVLRSQPQFLENAKLFILDEAHIIQDKHRGLKYEFLVTRLKRKLPAARLLMLSAVVPQKTLEDFAEWFNSSTKEDILTSTWRPSIQRYAKFEWVGASTTGVIRYAPDESTQIPRQFVPGVITQREFEFVNPESKRTNRRRFPQKEIKAQVAAELAYKLAELGPVLVFCTTIPYVNAVAKALQERINLAIQSGENLPHYFTGVNETRSALLASEVLGTRPIVAWLRNGIGVHHGRLPDIIRSAVETDVRQRKLRVLIATNTLAQGVNLPVKTVIFHSCWRYSNDEENERISARDYWNIAGRAGRAGEETAGLVIHINLTTQDERDYQYYLSRRQNVDPIESALYQKLVDLLQGRLSDEGLKAALDPEILALLVEEGPDQITDITVQEIIQGTLVRIQAQRTYPKMVEQLGALIVSTANDVLERTNDPQLLSVYSSTGLSSSSCQAIKEHVNEYESQIRTILMDDAQTPLTEALNLMLPICLSLPEMRPDQEFAGSIQDLLEHWIEGTQIQILMEDFSALFDSSEELGKFIDDVFRYRLPWGISAYIRIATEVLNIERASLTMFAKFLPSIVKYGLPNPASCWAMAIGVPFRRTAIQIAATYMRETQGVSSQTFLEWLSTLNRTQLQREFDLTGPMLEDVSRAIFLAAVNSGLRDFDSLDNFLPLQNIELQGTNEENRPVVVLTSEPGQKVEVARDYDDLVDRNAILVRNGGLALGYIPHDLAQILAPEMDTGANIEATINSIERGPIPKVTINITQGQ